MRPGKCASGRICAWFDEWEQPSPTGPWWPQWITLGELAERRPLQAGPSRPSWCYDTPGIARALQLAALAAGNRTRRATAERALIGCLADERQVRQIIDTSLCHGWPVSYTRSGTPPATPPTLNSSPLPTCFAPC
ncbi:lanthionine synthetase LanC family protein [Streptomyces sp. NBC_00203]|uniref:lanthionine synthetase LanC family protein n=1 Tax=Streptomyces sp. NBC_00203 TaxID=2975680 RepID=UPI00386599F5